MRTLVFVVVLFLSGGCDAYGDHLQSGSADVRNMSLGIPLQQASPVDIAKVGGPNDAFSEQECRARRLEALANGCIEADEANALIFMAAAPICDAMHRFARWEHCEHPILSPIRAVLNHTPECPAEWSAATGNCVYEKVQFTRKTPTPHSLGQRVLVIDFGLEPLVYSRYASRALDYLVPDEQGNYQTATESIEIPKAMHFIWHELIDKRTRLPAFAFNPIAKQFADRFGHTDSWPLGHGAMIFDRIANDHPAAEFVAARASLAPPDRVLCRSLAEGYSMESIRRYARGLANSLISAVKAYDVNYINMSFGHSLVTERGRIEESCPGLRVSDEKIRAMLRIWLNEFYYPLSSIEGVILVQAAAVSGRSLNEEEPDYLIDCVPLKNRIRVGVINRAEPLLSPFGANSWELLEAGSFNAAPCTDLFVNSGVGQSGFMSASSPDDQCAAWYSNTGVGAGIFGPIKTSHAAPLALSYLMAIRKGLPADATTEELLAVATNYGAGRLKDPARYELYPLKLFARYGRQE